MRINTININFHAGQSSMARAFLASMLGSSDTAESDPEEAPRFSAFPAIGSEWPGANGIYAGISKGLDGAADAHLVLLNDKPANLLDFSEAIDWAIGLGNDASLPTRFESALLFANLRDEFEADWHWTSTQASDSYAWQQLFSYGNQNLGSKDDKARARAVRRFIL